MTTEYAVEVYNKYHDNFVRQIDVFNTCEEAEGFVTKGSFDLNKDSEYVDITEIEYDDNENEIGRTRI